MIYMKLLHPFLAPFIEPAIDKVVSYFWGPQAVQGCPIKSNKNKKPDEPVASGSNEPGPSTSKPKED